MFKIIFYTILVMNIFALWSLICAQKWNNCLRPPRTPIPLNYFGMKYIYSILADLARHWRDSISLSHVPYHVHRIFHCIPTDFGIYYDMLKNLYSFSLLYKNIFKKKSVALQLRRAKTDWSGCCQMAVQGTLWLAKRYPSTLISVFLTGFRYFSYQVATQLSSRGWVDPVPDPILPKKNSRV